MVPEIALALILTSAAVATAPTGNGPDSWVLWAIGSGGGVVILGALFKTIQDYLKGRLQERESRTAGAVKQRDTAWRERDSERRQRIRAERVAVCESKNTRRALDYAAVLRRHLINMGVTEDEIPAEPPLLDCDLIPEVSDDEEYPGQRR